MQMQTSSAPLLTAAKLAELVALGHNRISQIYLHWTAGRYGQLYDDYHFNIDAAGKLVAALAQGLNIPIDRWNILTHCETALIDGYGPYSGDAETRWDLWYLRDSPGDGAMKPGGQVIRGKALWYAKSSPLV